MLPILLVSDVGKDVDAAESEMRKEAFDVGVQFLIASLCLWWYNNKKEKQAIQKWREGGRKALVEKHKLTLGLI